MHGHEAISGDLLRSDGASDMIPIHGRLGCAVLELSATSNIRISTKFRVGLELDSKLQSVADLAGLQDMRVIGKNSVLTAGSRASDKKKTHTHKKKQSAKKKKKDKRTNQRVRLFAQQ